MNDNNSGVGAVVIALVLVFIVGAVIWLLIESAGQDGASFEVDTNLPVGGGV